ncbi:hypothetical protein M758_7G033700 [Ceratodon purpureus]|nr:hypothetical protein M758_7G033700 [Ceratodon purpureus]
MPKIHVVHLGNSQQLMLAAEDAVGRALMRQRVRRMFEIRDTDVVFSMINSVSRGKGQDLFLRSFVEGVNMVNKINMVQQTVFTVHALLVGSDWAAPSYESTLRRFVKENDLERTVHFVNKSLDVVPYLAASDVLVQNAQGRGECFGRITIEAMAFQLPILGTAAGGTLEIVVNGSTGRLHPVGKEGVHLLAQNIRDLTFDKSLRVKMGMRGYARVKQKFMEHHMCERLGPVLQTVLTQTA